MYAERGNEEKIKKPNQNEENRWFSTLISLNSYKETTEALFFDNASAVFLFGYA